MDQSEALRPPATTARRVPVLLKRRRFLVNKRQQLKSTVLTATIVLILLVFINVTLYQASLRGTAEILADAPELSHIILRQELAQRLLVGVASLVFLGGVFVVGILETHRTAGAAFNIRRQMGEIAGGRYAARVRLRIGDNLTNLQDGFNAMAAALAERERHDIETLHRLADDVERGADGARIAKKLRAMATRNGAAPPPGS